MNKPTGMKEYEPIEITDKEVDELLCRIESKKLTDSDYKLLKHVIKTHLWLHRILEKQRLSINKLKKVFGIKTEKTKNLQKEDKATSTSTSTSTDRTDREKEKPEEEEEEEEEEEIELKSEEKNATQKKKGHGKNGLSAYQGLEHEKVPHPHPELSVGDICPGCKKGKLYKLPPCRVVRIISQPPISGKVYKLERLRCARCSKVFTAPPPPEAGKEKYSEETGAMIAVLKYGNGFPFHRLEQFQSNFNIPLPASTQWEIVERTANRVNMVFNELMRLAAQGGYTNYL